MSDIQTIVRSVVKANDQGKDLLPKVRKMPESEQRKFVEQIQDLRDAIAKLSKTVGKIKKAASPKDPFAVAGAKAKAAQQSAELEQKLGGYENITVPASSIGGVAGREFCVTGEVAGMEREDLQGLIKSHGGFVRNTITKGLGVLVIGSKPGPKKVEKARKRGIKIVQALDFIEMIEEG